MNQIKKKEETQDPASLQKIFKSILNNIKANPYFYIFFIISVIIFSIWLIAFYPGIMTPDSIDQWMQAYRFQFSNHHPYLHSLIIGILQRIWYNPAFIATIQIFIASIMPAYFLNFLIKRGLNKFIAFILLAFYLSSPSIGMYNVTLWKDIPFSMGIFGLCIIFVVSYLNGGFSKSRLKFSLLSLFIILVSFLRHNGILFLAFFPLILFAFKLLNLKRTLALLGICFIGFIFINNILATVLKVDKPNFIGSTPYIHFVAAAIQGGYKLNDHEKATLEKLISLESLHEKYDCRDSNPIVFNNPEFHFSVIEDDEYKKEFDKVALEIIRKNIPQVMGNRMCMFMNIIGFNQVSFYHGDPGIEADFANQYHLPQYQPNALSNLLKKYVNHTLIWPIPTHMYWNILPYIIITLGVALIRRNKLTIGFALISLFNLVPLFIGGVGPDYRFVYSVHITGIFIIALLFLPKKNNREKVVGWVNKEND